MKLMVKLIRLYKLLYRSYCEVGESVGYSDKLKIGEIDEASREFNEIDEAIVEDLMRLIRLVKKLADDVRS